MTDEMRAAEGLVRALAPPGCAVPIPEPFALDESRWLLRATDKGLVEFSSCGGGCASRRDTVPVCGDHFALDDGEPHHLFTDADGHHANLHRDYVPAIAAYARAVLDLGYDATSSRLHTAVPAPRRRRERITRSSAEPVTRGRSQVELLAADGTVRVLVLAKGDRRATRRLATALDITPTLALLAPPHDVDAERICAAAPSYLWIVGPNTVEPESHVFRLRGHGDDVQVARVPAVPSPG